MEAPKELTLKEAYFSFHLLERQYINMHVHVSCIKCIKKSCLSYIVTHCRYTIIITNRHCVATLPL